ncbi:MAG: hypothetical protein Q8P92_01370 [Candidatus Daviesbacteria bacterium]|nr:hypothetical protein [Candidatus Daviesbacteria bacterium]
MSLILETLNRGHVENFGFVFDNTRIRLSDDLPAISVPQFCEFSTGAIIQTYNYVDATQKSTVQNLARLLRSETAGLRVIHYQDPSSETELTTTEEVQESSEDIHIRRLSYAPQIADDLKKALEEKQLSDELARNLTASYSEALGVSIHNYSENPFRRKGVNIEIEHMYEISLPEFSAFTYHILRGGWFGWGGPDKKIIPDCAYNGVQKLSAILNN